MAKGKRYFLIIFLFLVVLFIADVKNVLAGEVLRFNITSPNSPYSNIIGGIAYQIFVSNQDNQFVSKIGFLTNFGSTLTFDILDNNNNLVKTKTSGVVLGSDGYYYYAINENLNNGWKLRFFYGGWNAVYYPADDFNFVYFTPYASGWYDVFGVVDIFRFTKIYVLSPDNPVITDISPNNVSFSSNFLSQVFTSSTPLTFWVHNANEFRLNFYIQDDMRKNEWDYQFSITPLMSFSNTSNQVKIDFQNQKLYVNNQEVPFSTGFQDNAYYGIAKLKIEAVNLLNGLTGFTIANYEFPPFSISTEEGLVLEVYNALTNSFYLFYDVDTYGSQPYETYPFSKVRFRVFSEGLTTFKSYYFRFFIFDITDGNQELIFSDTLTPTGDFSYTSPDFDLNLGHTYEVNYFLYTNGVLNVQGWQRFSIGQLSPTAGTTPSITFTQFYQDNIVKFGFSSTTTPTPAFSSFGSTIDNLFNKVFMFITPDKTKIENTKIKIIENLNTFISYINGFNSQLGYFSLLFYMVILLFTFKIVIGIIKIIKPF